MVEINGPPSKRFRSLQQRGDMMSIPVPDGYWIERSELEHYTEWFVFNTDHRSSKLDGDDPYPVDTITTWRYQDPDRHEAEINLDTGDGGNGLYFTADGARALAAALILAADESEGKLDA